jgi:type I restriction enzyme, S subunit
MRLRQKTKSTGLQWAPEIPSDWRAIPLKHICKFTTGWTPPTGDAESYIGDNLWANISDMGPRILSDTAKRISDQAVGRYGMVSSPAGTLLFSFKLSIGQISFVGTEMFTNEAIATFYPSDDLALSFAYYALPEMVPRNASENIYGAKMLNQQLIRSAILLVPPLREQTAIAAFLDQETAKIDALVAEQKRLIDLLKEKRQAAISHAVTKGMKPDAPMKDSGIEWLGEVPEHWYLSSVGRVCSYMSYGFTNPMPVADEGPFMLTANDIDHGRIRYESARRTSQDAFDDLLTDKSRPKRGDILLTKDGTLGRIAVHDGQVACINQSVAVLRTGSEVAPAFLAHALADGVYQERMIYEAGGTTIKHIYISRLAKMPIALPPQSEQLAIAESLAETTAKFDELIAAVKEMQHLLIERRAALVLAAVTGRIDLRSIGNVEDAA